MASLTIGHTLRGKGHSIALLGILILAAAFRYFGVNWDQSQHMHPDERQITMVALNLSLPWPPNWSNLVDPHLSTLNPHFFAYGSFPIYLLRLIALIASLANPNLDSYNYLNLVGRFISASFDLGIILVSYRLATIVYGRSVALLSAAFIALTVFHIQAAHFYAVDTLLTFFVLLSLLAALHVLRRPTISNSIFAGSSVGLALACKVSALPIIVPLVGAFLLASPPQHAEDLSQRRPSLPYLWHKIALLSLALTSTVVVFFITQPYALLDWTSYLSDVIYQNNMVRGIIDLPYTRQYVGTISYLYFLTNLTIWGMGPLLGSVAVAGTILVIVRGLRQPRQEEWLLLAWVIPYFLITGSFYAKFMRYLLPIMPLLSIYGAAALLWLRDRLKRQNPPLMLMVNAFIASVVLASLFYSLAFVSIYSRPLTRVTASRWIYEHIPPGSILSYEHWDDRLPFDLVVDGKHRASNEYKFLEMPLYEKDDQAKLYLIIRNLGQSDYIVFSSNRLYGSIPKSPERYPLTTRFYELLFDEKLGYHLKKVFTSYPGLFGLQLVDDWADESFTVYDHPKVLIFERTKMLSDEELREAFAPVLMKMDAELSGKKQGLLLTPAQLKTISTGGTYYKIFDRNGLENKLPILIWAVMIEVIGVAMLPLALAVFPNLSDGGYPFTKTIGLLILSWLTWISVSLGVWPNTRGTVFAIFIILTITGGCLGYMRRQALISFWRTKRGLILGYEAIFWIAFSLFVLIRLANPDLWHPYRGGEKPMDLAYLIATIKSASFPPYDPWFAGGYMNYYYFGQIIVATLIKLSGIIPTTAFNLVIPTLFALTFSGTFSLGYNISAGWIRAGRIPTFLSGLAAAIFATSIGNLGGALQIIAQVAHLGGGHGGEPLSAMVNHVLIGAWRLLSGVVPFSIPPDWYWVSSRIYPGATVNEFPLFTFLFADLHAHLIALPFTILLLGLVLNLVKGCTRGSATSAQRASISIISGQLPLLGILSLTLGGLFITNSWDFPTYLLISGVGLLTCWFAGARGGLRSLSVITAQIGAITLGSVLLYWPFHRSYQQFYFGLTRWNEPTDPRLYLVIHGLFLFIIGSYLLLRLALNSVSRKTIPVWEIVLASVVAVPLVLLQQTLIGLLSFLLILTLILAVQRNKPEEQFVLIMIGTGLVLSIFCELYAIKGDIGRMNTVFKLYLQVWILWAVASGACVMFLFRALPHSFSLRLPWFVGLGILLLASLVYPPLGTWSRLHDRFNTAIGLTLDGTVFMRHAVYHDERGTMCLHRDLEAITWIQDHISGTPVILEGHTPVYRWGGRVSIYTGLPTVLGWDWHQRQQRWGYQWMIDERLQDIQTMYSSISPEQTLPLLDKYDIHYIYVGDLERNYYPQAGLRKFDLMVGKQLDLVYNRDGVKIYKVRDRDWR
ncbi:MAG: DUF2298 domain-containing protein [Chloroflexi bacterium]|nr:DUF2298 domain-containing protein [Chloroflexota bacterium]MCL5075555.1 DUF2298 domain-containing protein [Chloroflexota bacterium]